MAKSLEIFGAQQILAISMQSKPGMQLQGFRLHSTATPSYCVVYLWCTCSKSRRGGRLRLAYYLRLCGPGQKLIQRTTIIVAKLLSAN